jgi:hypothetical protein
MMKLRAAANLFRENQYSKNIQHEHCENEQGDAHILAQDQSAHKIPITDGTGRSDRMKSPSLVSQNQVNCRYGAWPSVCQNGQVTVPP